MTLAGGGILLVLTIALSSSARAQAPSEPARMAEAPPREASPDAPRQGLARFFDPEDGQLDLSYFLENPRGFLPIPIVITEPAIGYGGGLAGMFLRPRKEAGSEGWARPEHLRRRRVCHARTGPRARSRPMPAGGSKGACARRSAPRPARSISTSTASAADAASLDQKVRYSLNFSGGDRAGQLAARAQVAVGGRVALCLRRRGSRSCVRIRALRGLPSSHV